MKKADIVLIAVIAVIVGILILVLYGFNNHQGAYVQIEIDGETAEVISLDEDLTKEITTPDGGKNTLVINDGSAKMTEADCPDGICVNHKKISRAGESIICLPHKVVITVIGDNETDDGIDAVA